MEKIEVNRDLFLTCINIIELVRQGEGDKEASVCGKDFMYGFLENDIDIRINKWKEHLLMLKQNSNTKHTQKVPAIVISLN